MTEFQSHTRGAVAATEDRSRAVFDALGEGLIVWDGSGRVLDCNRSASRILGIPQHELRRMPFEELMERAKVRVAPTSEPDSDCPHTESPAEQVRRTHEPVVNQVVGLLRANGERVWIEIDVRPVPDGDDGDIIVSSFRDITQRKAAEDRMRTLSAIVETSSDAILRLSVDGTIESLNAGAEALYGYPADDVIGCHLALIVPEDRRDELDCGLAAARGGRSISNLLTTRRRRDGALVDVVETLSPLFDTGGNVIGISCIAGDVSELVAARDAVARSEERFRSLVQRSADVALVLDEDGIVAYASPAIERFGYQPDEVVGRPGREFIHPDDVERHRERVRETVARTGTATVEWRFRVADGSYRWTEEVLTDMHDTPAVGGWVANIRDITRRRQAEAERSEAE